MYIQLRLSTSRVKNRMSEHIVSRRTTPFFVHSLGFSYFSFHCSGAAWLTQRGSAYAADIPAGSICGGEDACVRLLKAKRRNLARRRNQIQGEVIMNYVERGVVSDEHKDLLSVSDGQHRVPPVCLFLPPSSEGTKNCPMEGDPPVTPAGHSTEASSPGVSPFIQKQVESPSVELPRDGAAGKRQQVAEKRKESELNMKEWNDCSPFPGKREEPRLARNDFWLAVAVFVLIGLNSLMAWNVMLNLAPYMAASYFEGRNYGNTFLACFQGTCVSVQVALIYFKCKPKTFLFYAGAAINIVAFLAVTPAASSCEQRTAAITIHLICLFWGAASGLLQGAGYAYAGALPVNFAVFLSAGQGMAGLAAFALNTFLGFVFFDLSTRSGLTHQAWILYSVCAVFSAILSVCIFVLASRPWACQPFRDVARQQKDKAGKNPSSVMVCVEGDRRGSKLVAQKVLPSEEVHTQQAGRALYGDATNVHETAEEQDESTEVWTDLLDAECSKETVATRVVAPNCELLKERKISVMTKQTPSSHSLPSEKYAGNAGSAQNGDVNERTATKGYREHRQSVDAVRADVGAQLEGKTCDGEQAPKRNVLAVARQMWRPLLAILTTFFITLNLFPRIGPVGWHYTRNVPNHFVILFGLFSIADTLGRSTPSLQMVNPRWLGWTLIPERAYLFAAFTRVLFYVPFFLSYKLENCVVLNDFWWLSCLMLLFAFTHGWFTSMGFIHAVGKVPDSDKGIAGPLSVVALSLGVLLGLYVALAY